MSDSLAEGTLQGLLTCLLHEPDDSCHRMVLSDFLRDHDLWREDYLRKLVKDYPDSDGPRLLFADYSQEQTPDLALLIRLGVEHDNAASGRSAKQWWQIDRDLGQFWLSHGGPEGVAALLGARGRAWRTVIPRTEPEDTHLMVERGFISGVACPLTDWLQHGPGIARRHPVRSLLITDKEPEPPASSDPFAVWKWLWYEDGGEGRCTGLPNFRHALPKTVWDRMYWAPADLSGWQSSREKMMAALEKACLDWARAQP